MWVSIDYDVRLCSLHLLFTAFEFWKNRRHPFGSLNSRFGTKVYLFSGRDLNHWGISVSGYHRFHFEFLIDICRTPLAKRVMDF